MVVREATRHDVITRGLLWCGVAAGPLFLVTALAEGATRADYHPLRHPVSSLAELVPKERHRGWAIYSIGSAVMMLVFFGLASAAFNQVPVLVSFGGLSARRGHDRIRMAHRAGNPHTSRHAERVVAGGADFYPDEGVAPGFIAALSPDGVVRQVADEIAFSNGMADNSTLIIAESLRKLTRLAQPRLRTVGMRSPAAKTHAD
jgi:hypothetical protein